MRVIQMPEKVEMNHEQAAEYLGVTQRTLYNWNNSKRGPRSVRRFGRRMYRQEDLDAFLKANEEVQEAYS